MITLESYEAMRIAHDRVVAAQEGGQERLAAEEALRRMLWENRTTIIQVVEPQPNRYWEGRWRDEAAENDRLNEQLQHLVAHHEQMRYALRWASAHLRITEGWDKASWERRIECAELCEKLGESDQAGTGRGSGGDHAPDLRDPAPPRRDADGSREADDS